MLPTLWMLGGVYVLYMLATDPRLEDVDKPLITLLISAHCMLLAAGLVQMFRLRRSAAFVFLLLALAQLFLLARSLLLGSVPWAIPIQSTLLLVYGLTCGYLFQLIRRGRLQ